MARKEEYLPLPLRHVRSVEQIEQETTQFWTTAMEVFLLGGALNFTVSAFFASKADSRQMPWLYFWCGVVVVVALLCLIAKTRLKQIGMRTTFCSGVLVRPSVPQRPGEVLAVTKDASMAQTLVKATSEAYPDIPFDTPEQAIDLLLYAILLWYHQQFWLHWFRTPHLTWLGFEMTVGVADAPTAIVQAPFGIEGYASNECLRRAAQLRQQGVPVYGLAGLPTEFKLPRWMQMRVAKERWNSSWNPLINGQVANASIIFENQWSCKVEVKVSVSGGSILAGKEQALERYLTPGFADWNECYAWNYLISVRVSLNHLLRFHVGPGKPRLDRYHQWACDILEGLERDFRWPVPSESTR